MDLSMARSDVMVDRRLRMANSSPDVKALFNSPAYVYNLENQEEVETYPIAPSLQSVDYWNATTPVATGPGSGPMVRSHRTTASWSNTRLFGQMQKSTVDHRRVHDAIKRGSDSLLEAKLKEQQQQITK